MKNKWIWILAAVSVLAAAVGIHFLPDTIPMHFDFAGNVDRYGSKYELFLFSGINLFFALFWHLFIRYYDRLLAESTEDKKRAELHTNRKVLGVVSVMTMLFMLAMQAAFMVMALRAGEKIQTMPHDFSTWILAALGVMLAVLGNLMPKSRRNAMFGLRISWTLANDRTWQAAHRFSGVLLCVTGILIAVCALVLGGMMAVYVCIGLLTAAMIAVFVQAYLVYKKYGKEEN
ncbi:MAG: DUF1648 domain-containing protein [Oscillospiraceae bacterium]|nr:DUF1648 domain-containing protein [Oscillospiraceae bacterium]